MAGSKQWVVRLGAQEWTRFTYERDGDAQLRLLGSVQCGARIGALAIRDDGRYVQVNGDFETPLSHHDIRKALGKGQARNAPAARPPRRPEAPPPVIVVKRRRSIPARSDQAQAAASRA